MAGVGAGVAIDLVAGDHQGVVAGGERVAAIDVDRVGGTALRLDRVLEDPVDADVGLGLAVARLDAPASVGVLGRCRNDRLYAGRLTTVVPSGGREMLTQPASAAATYSASPSPMSPPRFTRLKF